MAPNPPDKRVQVKIEVGHQATCRENITPNGYTHNWTIFVRGAEGADISYFVEKVVFLLHESFPKPKRVKKEPPYEVSECGYGSFTLPVEIYFRNNKEEPRKYRLEYDLSLQLVGMPPLNITKVDSLTFLNPSDDFERKLIKGGATILGVLSSPTPNQMSAKPDPLSKTSPASSIGSSPGSIKKVHQNMKPIKNKETLNSNISHGVSQSVKRSNIIDETIMKVKKKKLEKSEVTNTVSHQKPVKEISVISPSPDVDPLKGKTIANVKKLKDRRKSTEAVSYNTENPKPVVNQPKEMKMKGKEIKIKKEKKDALKEEQPKLQFTIKRLHDAWSSINSPVTTNHNNNFIGKDISLTKEVLSNGNGNLPVVNETVLVNPMTTETKQNERVNALFAEFAEDDFFSSEDDTVKISKVTDTETKPVNTSYNSSADISLAPPSSHISTIPSPDVVKQKKIKTPKNGLVPNGKSHPGVKKEPLAKKVPRATDAGKTIPNGVINGVASKHGPITATTNTTVLEKHILYEIYEKLNNSEDDDLLQKIVDIVEDTGTFELTSSTFDFDLRILTDETLSKIKTCLDIS